MKTWIKKKISSVKEKLGDIKSKPGPVCLGFALGIFLGTTPFVGFKVLIAIALTWVLGWSRIASVVGVMQFNVVTGPIFYGFSFIVGKYVLGYDLSMPSENLLSISGFFDLLTGNLGVFWSLLVGGIVLGIPLAVLGFFITWYFIKSRKRTKEVPKGLPTGNCGLPTADSRPVYTLITGASTGLGRELAIGCAKQGRNLLMVSLPGEYLLNLCHSLEKEYGILVAGFELDLTDRKAIERLAETVLSRYRINCLINNAGTGGTKRFEDSTIDYLDRIILLNVRATALLTRLMLPELKRHRGASVMNISSMAAFSPMPFKTIYPASKAFVMNFSRSLDVELRGSGVRVVSVHPGPIMTNPDVTARILRQKRMGRIGLLKASEVARVSLQALRRSRSVIVPGFGNKFNLMLIRYMPETLRMRVLLNAFRREL